jgi:hypothetical protein
VDLNKSHPAVHYTEANERRNRIIKQTKDKYCRGRATVEKDINAVYVLAEKLLPNTPQPPAQPKPQLLQPLQTGKGSDKKSIVSPIKQQGGLDKLTSHDIVE